MVMMEKGPVRKYVADAAIPAYKKDGFTVVGGEATSEQTVKGKTQAKAGKKKAAEKKAEDVAEEVDVEVTEETMKGD